MNIGRSFLFEAPLAPISPSAGGVTQPSPKLIKVEKTPSYCTLYVDIPLKETGHQPPEAPARPMTCIFFPDGYHLQESVDLIVYLHGYKRGAQANWSIDRYLHNLPSRAFREGLNKSQKNALLIAPTLGSRSNAGWLIRAGGFDRYMDLIMQTLDTHGPYEGKHPTVGNIILACHSGGGVPMRLIAGGGMSMHHAAWTSQHYTSLIRECWGFDCTYSQRDHIDSTEWGIWANQRPDTQLYIHYIKHSGTAPEAEKLQQQGRSNVTVIPSSTPIHDLVPITYWIPRLQQASFLNDK